MEFQIKAAVFIVVTLFIAILTRSSLRNFRSHGFYRFFAFIAIIILILLNIDFWFSDPFSSVHIFSWFLLCISGFWLIYGVIWFIGTGKADPGRDNPTLLELEKTTELVTTGAYRYIRHPLYSSLLFLAWGTLFKNLTILTIILAAVSTVFLVLTAKAEESENIEYFGEEYRGYMRKTKMFIPFLF